MRLQQAASTDARTHSQIKTTPRVRRRFNEITTTQTTLFGWQFSFISSHTRHDEIDDTTYTSKKILTGRGGRGGWWRCGGWVVEFNKPQNTHKRERARNRRWVARCDDEIEKQIRRVLLITILHTHTQKTTAFYETIWLHFFFNINCFFLFSFYLTRWCISLAKRIPFYVSASGFEWNMKKILNAHTHASFQV